MSLPTLLLKGNLEPTKYSPSKKKLDEYVPIDYIMNFFEKKINKKGNSVADRILVIKSSTGSGKSTLLPPEFYHRFFDGRSIGCTQPRVFNAKDVPKNVIPFHTRSILPEGRTPLEMGKNIGYQTQHFIRKPIKGIIYMTVGIIQAQLIVMSSDDFINKYSVIFIDEAHERSADVDSVLFMLKQLIEQNYQNPKCPFVVVMSATIDTEVFCNYLLGSIKKSDRYKNIINVAGSTYPIERIWLKYDSPNIFNSIIEIIKKIHKEYSSDFILDKKPKSIESTKFRDIAVFIPGASHAERLSGAIRRLNETDPFFNKYPCIPLFISGEAVEMESEEYLNVFRDIKDVRIQVPTEIWSNKKSQKGNSKFITKSVARRIILATPTMETGVTIETLKHVIESGLIKQSEYNPTLRVETLITKPVTLDISDQRKGRVGRKHEGVCWYIYTQDTMNQLVKHPNPSIIENKIDNELLQIIFKLSDPDNKCNEYTLLDLFNSNLLDEMKSSTVNINNLDLFTVPPVDSIQSALEKLFVLGAIDSNSIITTLGIMMIKLSTVEIEMIRLIYAGFLNKTYIADLITIVAFLQIKSSTIYMDSRRKKLRAAIDEGELNILPNHDSLMWELLISDEFISNLIYFNEFLNAFENKKDLRKWCLDRGFKYGGFLKLISKRDEIILRLANAGINPYYNSDYSLRECHTPLEVKKQTKRFKKCLFEAYKMNIATRIKTGEYLSIKTNVKFSLRRPVLEGYEPSYILYDKLFGLVNPRNNLYEYFPSFISVLDGYIAIDLYYDTLL